MKKLNKEDFAQTIDLNKEAYEMICKQPLKEEDWKRYKYLFYYRRDVLYDEIEPLKDKVALPLFLVLYFELFYDRYFFCNEKEEQMILDGAKDLGLWANICKYYFGFWGIIRYMYKFLDRIIEGRMVRLHRLEFEAKALEEDLCIGELYLKEGSIIINVHIPEGPPLTKDDCDHSYALALAYFKSLIPIFICDSWILSPVLQEVLPRDSNLVRFQKEYIVYEVHEDDDSIIPRLFLDHEDLKVEEYPEDTMLQRKVKAYLLQGKKIKAGKGVLLSYYHEKISMLINS